MNFREPNEHLNEFDVKNTIKNITFLIGGNKKYPTEQLEYNALPKVDSGKYNLNF